MIDLKGASFPPWVILHLPHDSTDVPEEVREQFLLNDHQLAHEIRVMTDMHTLELFAVGVPEHQVVRSPVSRLVIDVERFEQDDVEQMAARGMGVIYRVTHDLRPLRRPLFPHEREELLCRWYRPHHKLLSDAVDRVLEKFGQAFVIDAHSFPSKALPYETDHTMIRPEICIGTDSYHTTQEFVKSLKVEFQSSGFMTAVNTPFAGALVPDKHYRRDLRVKAVMIEVRRDLYLDESAGTISASSAEVSKRLRTGLLNCLARLPCAFSETSPPLGLEHR